MLRGAPACDMWHVQSVLHTCMHVMTTQALDMLMSTSNYLRQRCAAMPSLGTMQSSLLRRLPVLIQIWQGRLRCHVKSGLRIA